MSPQIDFNHCEYLSNEVVYIERYSSVNAFLEHRAETCNHRTHTSTVTGDSLKGDARLVPSLTWWKFG